MRRRLLAASFAAGLAAFALAGAGTAGAQGDLVRVGSKKFTESVVLGELVAQLAQSAGMKAQHVRELGGTRILYDALLAGEIDAYAEYTGTLRHELLPQTRGKDLEELRAALAEQGLRATAPLGFQNTYAIGLREEVARKLGIRTLTDLAQHPEVRLSFGNEFMDRADGWPGLSRFYGLRHQDVRGMDHDLAYQALRAEAIDGTDVYTTDAEIRALGLRSLVDDRHFFPEYHALILYRAELEQTHPEVVAAFRKLEGRIDEDAMIAMNARAKLEGVPESVVARDFLGQALGLDTVAKVRTFWARLGAATLEHLALVGISMLGAIALGLPLGLLAARRRGLGQGILAVVGVVQTIPSLALLVFMIPLLGIGSWPAIAALFLYGLLPIVRNTHAGIVGIPADLRDSAQALGLPPRAVLLRIELPLASRSILAGIKTAAVINVGTATLGALIGAGGYGQAILTGIRLAQTGLILEGAVPAAALALVVQGLFDLLERVLVPRGLRLEKGS